MLAGNWQELVLKRHDAAGLTRLETGLRGLAGSALQPAGYQHPSWLLPVLKTAGHGELLTVMSGITPVLALVTEKRRLPFPRRQSLVTPLGSLGLPLIDRDIPAAALQALLASLASPLLLRGMPVDGPAFERIKTVAPHFAAIEMWQRAALRPTGSFEDWMDANFERKRRKEFRRLRNRLAEEGALVHEALKADDDCAAWVDDLLALEAEGWKGRRGTALKSSAPHVSALHEAVRLFHGEGRLRFWRIKLNGRTLASLFAIVEDDEAWLGKIAYAEDFSRFSPGVMVILDATRSFFAEGTVRLVDSCAIPGHPMIDNIWRDRVGMADILIASGDMPATTFNVAVAAERGWRGARNRFRDLFHLLTGRHRS
jgi:CelD/BcsL family acetyltransferase involved in cellulose biosynthesis